ncbi:MAG: potassium transporter [Muribaculaceae bacterium]|nr:potassium transporter [Muribaculaceae bacterium]
MIKSFFHSTRRISRRHAKNIARYRKHVINHFTRAIAVLKTGISTLAIFASLFCLIELTLYFGYDRSAAETLTIRNLLRIPQAIFLLNIIFGILVATKFSIYRNRVLKIIVDLAVAISAIAWAYPHPRSPWFPWLADIVYSNAFLFAVLAAYSVLELCHAAMRLIGRRTNPALILSGSFLVFIIIGSFLLMLPKCTLAPISYCDSLFVSTSAVCITGLTPVDIPTTFTPLGLLILSLLIQIGGLGVITFTSFFAIFFSGTPSIYSQLLIKDMIYSKSINNLIPTLLYILAFTITVELIGAVAIFFTIPAALGLTLSDKLIFSGFHSLSSFCNAGFSCLPGGMANQTLLNGTQSIYVVTSVLIFAGAIGFPILVNFKDIFVGWLRRLITGRRNPTTRLIHVYDLNTKLVLVTTLVILAVGSIAFFIFEYNNTLAGMPIGQKITQSVFNSLIPRSAGFSSVNPSMFLPVTMLLIIVQMWIGGASQSLAGGIKVNTVAAVFLNLRAIIRGQSSAQAFGRRISTGSIRRANAVVAIAIAAFIIYAAIILTLEPHLSTKSILFEVTSALFTVGSSLGITDQLSPLSKIILSTAMFAGRVGILSLLIGFGTQSRDKSLHYPTDNIIIS